MTTEDFPELTEEQIAKWNAIVEAQEKALQSLADARYRCDQLEKQLTEVTRENNELRAAALGDNRKWKTVLDELASDRSDMQSRFRDYCKRILSPLDGWLTLVEHFGPDKLTDEGQAKLADARRLKRELEKGIGL